MQKKNLDIFTNILSSVREPLVILDPDLKIFIKTPLKIMRIKDALLVHYSC